MAGHQGHQYADKDGADANAHHRGSNHKERDVNIRAFWKGLFVLGFLNLCRDYADLTNPLFVHCEEEFTRENLCVMAAVHPSDHATIPDAAKAFNFFEKYVKERASLMELVSTCLLQHPTSHVKMLCTCM